MIKIFKTNCNFFLFFLLLTSLSSQTMSKNIIDVIKEDSELSIFYSNLKKTGLDEVLQKNYLGNGQFLHLLIRLLKLHQTD